MAARVLTVDAAGRAGAGGRRAAPRAARFAWLILLACPAAAAAPVIGVVKTADDLPAFEDAIKSLTAACGGEVVVESLAADKARWAKVHEKLGKRSPAVWVPVGPLALEQAAAAGIGAPVVFMMVPTVDARLPQNVAGVQMRLSPEAQLAELHRLLPAARRVGVLHDPKNTGAEVAAAEAAAKGLGLTIVKAALSDVRELGGALKALLDESVDVLWMVPDRTVTPVGNREAFEFIAASTIQQGVPVVGYAPKLTEAGALFSLGPDHADIGLQAAEMVRKAAAGVAPGQLGVEAARKVTLTVNRKVASTLGIALPEAAIAKAVQVFE